MNRALVFLVRRSLRNRIVYGLRRLKQPRYLVPALLGVAYFGLIFGGQFMGSRHGRGSIPELGPALGLWGTTAGLLLLGGMTWILPSKSSPLMFLESEVALLFPAPVSRQDLVRYKLVAMQVPLLFTSALMTLFVGARSGPSQSVWFFLGALLGFNVLSLHNIAVHFAKASLLGQGISGFRRIAPALCLLAAFVGAVILLAPKPDFGAYGDLPRGQGKVALLRYLAEFTASPAAYLLYPVSIVASLPFSTGAGEFLLRLPAVLGMGWLLMRWVLRADVAFEEAAVEQAGKIAERLSAMRKGRLGVASSRSGRVRRAPWRLAPTGPAEGAFVWRSFTAASRNLSPRLLLFLTAMTFLVLGWLQSLVPETRGATAPVASIILFAVSVVLSFGGAALVGSGLKQDLELLEFLKTLPVAPTRFFRAQVLGSTAPVAALQVLLLVSAWLFLPAQPRVPDFGSRALAGLVAALLILPAQALMVATMDAGLAVMFPAWVRPRGENEHPGGMEAMGQGILTMLVRMLGLVGFALPPALLGGGVVLLAVTVAPPVLLPAAVALAAVAAAGAYLLEFHLACSFFGERFHRLDPSRDGLIQ